VLVHDDAADVLASQHVVVALPDFGAGSAAVMTSFRLMSTSDVAGGV
jgi:hypothetical protein